MSTNDRLFKFSDAELIQHAEVIMNTLPVDIADFSVFDSTIQPDYQERIRQALIQCNTVKADSLVVNEQAELTQRVNNAMAACNTSFKTILFFAKKAFAGNVAVQKQFGIGRIEKIRRSQAKLVLFMETFVGVVQKYQGELTMAGCNLSVVMELPLQVDELKYANIEQEKSKKERPVITQERINYLNALYLVLKPVHEIAQVIYSDDPARLAKYSLPYPKSSNNNPEDLVQS